MNRFVTVGPRRRERFACDAELRAERQHVRREERRRRSRQQPQPPVPEDEAAARLVLAWHHLRAEAQRVDERQGVGRVVEKPVRAPLAEEFVDAFRAEVASCAIGGFEDHDVAAAGRGGEAMRTGEAGDAGPDDRYAGHGSSARRRTD